MREVHRRRGRRRESEGGRDTMSKEDEVLISNKFLEQIVF